MATTENQEASNSDPVCQERSLLVSTLHQITECLESTVGESKDVFQATQDVHNYISLDNPKGIRQLFAPMAVYARALSTLGYRTWQEVEGCVSKHYRIEAVQQTVEDLLSAEESYKNLVSTVEIDLEKYETKQAYKKTITAGDFLPAELTLSLVDGSIPTLESYLKRSKFTLFILIRHFG